MVKAAIIRNKLSSDVYQDVIKFYKKLLREGDKKKLYFFKGLVYAALNHEENKGWRRANEYLGEMCLYHEDYFESYYRVYNKNKMGYFGMEIPDCIKKLLW